MMRKYPSFDYNYRNLLGKNESGEGIREIRGDDSKSDDTRAAEDAPRTQQEKAEASGTAEST